MKNRRSSAVFLAKFLILRFKNRRASAVFRLQKPEIDLDDRGHSDRFTVLFARREFPLFDGFDGLFVQSQSEAARDPNVGGAAAGIDFHVEQHRPLELGLARLLRIFRFDLEEQRGRGYSAARLEHSATSTAAVSGSEAATLSGPEAAALAWPCGSLPPRFRPPALGRRQRRSFAAAGFQGPAA